MHGFHNRILDIDVTERSFRSVALPDEALRRTLGGKGLGIDLLLRHNPAGVDPLGPGNRLVFALGPATGSSLWGSCRYGVFTKSPQTGFLSESYSGGTAAERMVRTGFDAIMFSGASPALVWIEVSDEGVLFHDAGELRGLSTYAAEDRVREWLAANRPECPQSAVVTIGPAGENQVVFSVIENDYWRSAGRTGVGAVMGAKRIKAIAFRGGRRRELADPADIRRYSVEMAGQSKTDRIARAYKSQGTPMLVDLANEAGIFPTRYWSKGRAGHWESINAPALHQRCQVQPHACLKCFMACGRLSTVRHGRHAGLRLEGPEYETIYAFGGLCEVPDIEEVLYLNDVCDRLGLDTISAGNLAALAIEAKRQGRIAHPVDYGRVDEIAELLHDTAHRRGIGEVLARGIRAAAAEWGMEDQAIHVKGLEPAGYDPRVLKGMGLSYATSPRGACHLRTTFYKPELSGLIPASQIEGKAAMVAEWEDRLILFDCLVLCRFYRDHYQWAQLGRMVRGLTGLDLDTAGLRTLAGAVADLARLFNLREGLRPEDDRLPRRFHREALPETGEIIREEDLHTLLREYYRARGWDEQGQPREWRAAAAGGGPGA